MNCEKANIWKEAIRDYSKLMILSKIMKILVKAVDGNIRNECLPYSALLLLPLPRGHWVYITAGAITLRTSLFDKSSHLHFCGFRMLHFISCIPMGFETIICHELNFSAFKSSL
jgi:hypothetical protein